MGNKNSSSKTTDDSKTSNSLTQNNVVAVDREPLRTSSRLNGLPNYQNAAVTIQNNVQSNAGVHFSAHTQRVVCARASDQEINTDNLNKNYSSVGHISRGHTHYRQDNTFVQRDIRDTSVHVTSRDPIPNKVVGGPGQRRNIGTIQNIQYSGLPSGGPAGFGGYVALDRDQGMNRDTKTERQSIVGHPSRSHTSHRLGNALDQGMNSDTRTKRQPIVGHPSRSHTSHSLDNTLDQGMKTETEVKKYSTGLPAKSHTPYRFDSSTVDPGKDTDTTIKKQSSVADMGLPFNVVGNCGLNAYTNTIQKKESSVGSTALRSSTRKHNRQDNGLVDQGMSTNTTQTKTSSVTDRDYKYYTLSANQEGVNECQSSVRAMSSDPKSYGNVDTIVQSMNTNAVQSMQSSMVTYRSLSQFRSDVSDHQVINTDLIQSPKLNSAVSKQVDDIITDTWSSNLPFSMSTNGTTSPQDHTDNLPFSLQDGETALKVEDSVMDNSVPFNLQNGTSTRRGSMSAPNALPTSYLDDAVPDQVEKHGTENCLNNLPFSLQDDTLGHPVDEANIDIATICQASLKTDDISSKVVTQGTQNNTCNGGTRSLQRKVHPPLNENECLVSITLPGAVDWQVALDGLQYTLSRFKFKLQDLQNKSRKLHSKKYVVCFENKEEVPSAIDILKNGKINAVLCEVILDKSINDILKEKDKALASHQKKFDEVMQSIDSLQGEKKRAGKTKMIALDKWEKRKAEKEALTQKALELNCQKKEFADIVCKLIDRILSLKEVKVGWKELDSEIKEVKQLMEREKDRLNKALPIYAKRSVITDTVKSNQVSIILGETGSGKSTQVVQYLYDSGLAEKGVIVCTQPRKVAAFSLEKYVCEEMKESGHVVECSVGARAADKRAKKTKILFTTDYSLLMECIKDQDLTRFSCVIIDEAHERNMNTDLLLGIIKKALPRRPDLRVIITSATINPDLFIKYFGDCPVVKVSGKTFPVDVIWKKEKKTSGDYVLEAVEKVVEIHQNEEAGDVLVFLTCPAEIEQACTKVRNRIKKDDIQFLPLHGKLQQEEQREVFKPTPKGKRKVVFSTNCAETSLTIPGIKFVVDTGKAKEMKYDPKRNINSLEVADVSQSSADQRKGRAGRIESGKCYRLYTEDDFNAMEKSSKPEILRVNLGQALLKLMELGIRNPADFDYVESPSVESIKTAMMELEELGATCGGQLTELGKKMAKVPVDPGLSKFLFEGFERGVGYEALVLVSVATITGNVFFRMGTEEEKKAADMKKVEFCHLGGDFMTLLDVYRSWQKVDKRDRGRWCFEKSLNAKAMRMADETVNDLKSTLKHELKMSDIKWSSLDKETTDGRLQKTLFSCFMTKLCVYTGHERRGYKTITGGHFVKIHPSSSVNFTGSNPKFIVYEKILKTSQDFLLNVTPIETSWLQESIAEKKLHLDIEEVLAEVLMVPLPSIRCSSILMKRAFEPFRSKLPCLEKNISDSCNSAPIVVEAKRNAGKVDLFVPKNYSDKAVELTQKILEEQRERIREETRECPVIAESSALRVVMEKGLTVQQILLPDMYRSVVVRNLQDRPLHPADVKEFLCQFGKLIDFNSYRDMHFATYEKPEEATLAVEFCTADELGYRVEPKRTRQMSQQGRDSSHFNFRIKITWHRREPKGMANVSFENQPEEVWYEISSISELTIRSRSARVRRDKHREKTLFLHSLSTNTTKQDIREAVETFFHGCITIRDQHILIQYKQRETMADTGAQKTVLEKLISRYARPGSFEVTVLDVPNKSPFGVANADFLNPNEGIQVVGRLSGKRCYGLNRLEMWEVFLEVKPYLNFFDTCMTSVYDLVKDEVQSKIDEIAKECAENCKHQLRLKEKPAKSKGRIELSVDTTCLEHHLQASKEISKCIQGEKIECSKPSMFLLGKSGRDHLKEIQKQSGAFICTDERTMAITLYGTSEQKEKARDAVYRFIQDLALQGSTVWEVNLKEDGRPRGLMKQLMSKYGREFEGLLEIEGVNKVDIYLSKQVLKVQSTPDAKSHVLRVIQEIAKTIAPIQPNTGTEIEEEECPICFCAIDDETTSYRLAICGHACCMTCIEQQFNAAVFPLCCTHEDCPEMFALDMIDLLTQKKELHDKVMKMSLKSYVDANQDKARYCPTPDCPMVYPVTTNGKLFRCSVCSTAICSSCHQPYHLGLTCKENEIDKTDPGKALLEKWMNEKPGRRKRCPSCNSPIEKNGGCNHMECVHCKSHLCWPCMEVFSTGAAVYAHQAFCPIRVGN